MKSNISEHSPQELFNNNQRLKAIISKRSPSTFSIEIFRLNEGIIPGYGQVHSAIWENMAGPFFVDSLQRAQEVTEMEFRRFDTTQ